MLDSKWAFVVMFLLLSGCATTCKERVPSGTVGMCKTTDGFEEKPLAPGWHTCWRRGSKMHHLEVSDQEYVIDMNVLCQDSLNFKFDVAVLASVNKEDPKKVVHLFQELKPKKEAYIPAPQVFNTYARKVVDQEARKVVSKYKTTDIVGSRKKIIEEIRTNVTNALDGSIVKVKRVSVNNLDFPKVVTEAQQKKARRKVEIKTEKAQQKKRKLKAKNDIEIAKMNYRKRLIEAATTADSNKIIGNSISKGYLGWWQLKVLRDAAKGPNNWGFIPYSDMANGQIQSMDTSKHVLEEELENKIRKLRKGVKDVRPSTNSKKTP